MASGGCQETVAECDCTKGGTDATRHIMALQRQRKRVPEREERSFYFTPSARLKVGFTCKNGEHSFEGSFPIPASKTIGACKLFVKSRKSEVNIRLPFEAFV